VSKKSHRYIQSLSDADLVEIYRQSEDRQVIAELFNRYLHLVYGLCLKYLHDREESKDAVMSVFESLPGKILKHEIRDFRPWLYVITRNHCLMHLRSEKTKDEKQKTFILEQTFIMENEEVLHPVDEESSRNDHDLKDCIEKLGTDQKECILLFYYKNKCYREIASQMKTDEKKVKSHLQNGKRNLKNCMEHKIHVRQKES
jgi:RNA polymerase sigma-70 factor (ECF subfamily)